MPKRYPNVTHAPLQCHVEHADALFRYRSLSHVLSR